VDNGQQVQIDAALVRDFIITLRRLRRWVDATAMARGQAALGPDLEPGPTTQTDLAALRPVATAG